MNNRENELEIILRKYDLASVIYADSNGRNITAVGALDSLPHTGLIETLFGGEREVKNLFETTLEQILPFGWGQGSLVCWVDVTSNNKIFGAFKIVEREDVLEDYGQSRNYCMEVKMCLERLVDKS